ncbi:MULTISPECIES: DUF11 domain-containing protein [Streptomyces]|uniref:DUF11 domain-containing protein n=1 Tax=Streptomyces TaxID=1883 RepID=UPI000D11E40F|nr:MULTISPECIES: DUF11 domain-containing protein [Streptomyces]WRK41753.1 DUF11 domain-containing protein [Streptomyces venezuelae]
MRGGPKGPGPSPATGVTVADRFPNGLVFRSAEASDGNTRDPGGPARNRALVRAVRMADGRL